MVRVTRVAEGALAGRHRVVVLGRAKSTVKLSNGHWIFSETLEDVYRTCAGDPKIEYVMIHGDARHSQLVAVVDVGGAWDGASKTREDLEEELLRRLQAHAAAMGQAAHEFVGAVVLARTPFSRFSDPQTLNGTGKLHRRNLERLYHDDIERAYASLAANSQGAAMAGLDRSLSFRAQGGSSLAAARIANIYVQLGIPVSRVVKLLLDETHTVGDAASLLHTESLTSPANPEEDAQLPDDIAPVSAPSGGTRVLITGATGFLGPFVVAQLVREFGSVLCLVRARSDAAAYDKWRHAAAKLHLWEIAREGCGVEIVRGDVGVQLGLQERTYNQLVSSVAVVVHLAAVVNVAEDYAFHRRANVLGTLNLVRFCSAAGARLIFASSTDGLWRPFHEAQFASVSSGVRVCTWVGR